MSKFEIVIEVRHEEAREALANRAAHVRRTGIEDAFFRDRKDAVVRLRRQDTVSRLACLRPSRTEEPPETVVLDYRAARQMLLDLGLSEIGSASIIRETWRSGPYLLHLDRVRGIGDFLTLEASAEGRISLKTKRRAVQALKGLGFQAAVRDCRLGVDSPRLSAYTAPINKNI
jgi:adenylate cyclase class IV